MAFDQLAGSSNFDASYTFNQADHGNLGSYPLYHTSYEVFDLMKKFIDPGFEVNESFLSAMPLDVSSEYSRRIEL